MPISTMNVSIKITLIITIPFSQVRGYSWSVQLASSYTIICKAMQWAEVLAKIAILAFFLFLAFLRACRVLTITFTMQFAEFLAKLAVLAFLRCPTLGRTCSVFTGWGCSSGSYRWESSCPRCSSRAL